MRSILPALFLLFLSAHSGFCQSLPGERVLQPAAMQEDFTYLRHMLEETHPGLYMHSSKEAMQSTMDSLGSQLASPLPFFDFYKKIAFLIARIGCEHTYCNYGQGFDSLIRTWKLFPFQPHFVGSKAVVAVNRTTDPGIQAGDELVSVNGRPMDNIREELYQYIPADGWMLPSRNRQLSSMAFSIWYYEFIGQPDTFRVTIRNKKGQLLEKIFDRRLTLMEGNENAMKNPSNKKILALSRENEKRNSNPWRLELLKGNKTAVMTVHTFSADREFFLKRIDSLFTMLFQQKTPNLIIDISNNGGGDEELAAALLSYLVARPTRFIENEYLITDSTAYLGLSDAPEEVLKNRYAYIEPLKDGKSVVKLSEYSQELKPMEPKPNGFRGKVYLYVNGITSSAASTFAAVAQSNGLATVVGEETAGSFAGGGTVIGLNLTLPHSGITAHTSIVYQQFATQGRDKDRGVMPDKPFEPGFSDLLDGNKGWREFVLRVIGE